MSDYDAVIVGGGPAGSALAVALAQAGRNVVLIEKSRTAQHKVCGEFLSPESLPFLRRAGVDPADYFSQAIHSVRLATREVIAEAELPVIGQSLTRRTLDEALLQRAEQAGATVLRGTTAESLSRDGGNSSGSKSRPMWRAQVADGAGHAAFSAEGRDAFLATGKHDLHGWPRAAKRVQGGFVAMKMYFALTPQQRTELAGHVELILYPGGYAGLQLVEDGYANLCALIGREKLRSFGGWDKLLEHMQCHSVHLARRLAGARAMLGRPLALSAIPYGYCAPIPATEAALWRLGDQAAVIPSFSGDGMAIALHTADRAAQLYLEGATPAIFQAEIRRQLAPRLELATLISRAVTALPSLSQVARLWPSMLSGIFMATRIPRAELV